jgi:hypothetical protein
MSELAEGLAYIAKWKDIEALATLRVKEDRKDLRSAAKELTKEHYDIIRDLTIQLNNENTKQPDISTR